MTAPKQEEEYKLFLPDPEPEPAAVTLKAVCGFLIGLVIAGVVWLQWRDLGQPLTILLFTVVPVGLAYGATKCDDEFWRNLKDDFWW
jgi:hypothetical protein